MSGITSSQIAFSSHETGFVSGTTSNHTSLRVQQPGWEPVSPAGASRESHSGFIIMIIMIITGFILRHAGVQLAGVPPADAARVPAAAHPGAAGAVLRWGLDRQNTRCSEGRLQSSEGCLQNTGTCGVECSPRPLKEAVPFFPPEASTVSIWARDQHLSRL